MIIPSQKRCISIAKLLFLNENSFKKKKQVKKMEYSQIETGYAKFILNLHNSSEYFVTISIIFRI